MCLSTEGGWSSSMPCRFSSPHPVGKLRGIWPGGSPDPHPRGKLRGSGQGGLQAHTQGGSWGNLAGGSLGPHPGISRPTPRGWVGESPGPHLEGVYPSMHWGRLPQQLLLRVVCILLECILVNWLLFQSHVNNSVVFSYSWPGKRMLFFHSTIYSYQYYLLSDPVLSLDLEF